MKYVIFETGSIPTALIFDPLVQHSSFKGLRPVSAGFFSLSEENVAEKYDCWMTSADFVPKVSVWGESVSLDIKSRPEDAEIIERTMSHNDT